MKNSGSVIEIDLTRKEWFYLTTHIIHFIYRYKILGIITITQTKPKRHIYAPSHKQDYTYYDLCYISCGTMAGMSIPASAPQLV